MTYGGIEILEKKHGRVLSCLVVIIVLTSATNASATFSFFRTDNTGYDDARTVGSLPLCYYDEDYSKDSGFVAVKGDHNAPFGPDVAKMEIVMRFRATEDSSSFEVSATWVITYMLETNWPVGEARIEVRYVLYSDSYSGLESRNAGFSRSINTPLFGGYNSINGIVSKSGEDSVTLYYDLQDGTWYRVAVQLYIYLDGEANAWSQAGADNPIHLDVVEIIVSG